jgi:hypothetical protein
LGADFQGSRVHENHYHDGFTENQGISLGHSGKNPGQIVTTILGPMRSGGTRKQGLTSRERSGHPKHGLENTA